MTSRTSRSRHCRRILPQKVSEQHVAQVVRRRTTHALVYVPRFGFLNIRWDAGTRRWGRGSVGYAEAVSLGDGAVEGSYFLEAPGIHVSRHVSS